MLEHVAWFAFAAPAQGGPRDLSYPDQIPDATQGVATERDLTSPVDTDKKCTYFDAIHPCATPKLWLARDRVGAIDLRPDEVRRTFVAHPDVPAEQRQGA